MKRIKLQEGKGYFDTDAMYQDYPDGFKVGRVTIKPSYTDEGLRIDDGAYSVGTRKWTRIESSDLGRVVVRVSAQDITQAGIDDLIMELKKCQKEMAAINENIRKYQLPVR